jgi:aldehyde:ferredoxin oxidoreductase
MQYGYTGEILRVDLSSGSVTKVPTLDYSDRFIGGKGIATKIYWDEVTPEVKALDPENRLIFMTGPLAGFPGVAGSMWQIHGRSPATIPEHFCYGSLGGSWGAHLKFAGYDGIVIQGKSEKRVYLYIDDDGIQIRDASTFWGKGAVKVREALKRRLGSSAKVATIGPAGENRVSFANVIADNDSSAAGGFGAVMGSKNLKAVVVRGHQKVMAARPEKLRELAIYLRRLREGVKEVEFGLIPDPGPKDEETGLLRVHKRLLAR